MTNFDFNDFLNNQYTNKNKNTGNNKNGPGQNGHIVEVDHINNSVKENIHNKEKDLEDVGDDVNNSNAVESISGEKQVINRPEEKKQLVDDISDANESSNTDARILENSSNGAVENNLDVGLLDATKINEDIKPEYNAPVETEGPSFPYDPSKKFNKQQDPVFFPGDSLLEYLEAKEKELQEEWAQKLEDVKDEDLSVAKSEDSEVIDNNDNLKNPSDVNNDGSKNKKKKIGKPKKAISKEKLLEKGFPKIYYDPTDKELDEKTGKINYFYNVENTLRKNHLLWITKIIPLDKLESITYDNSLFDNYADKQHELAVKLNQMSGEEQYQYEIRKKTLRIIVGFVISLLLVAYIVFARVPGNNYDRAVSLFEQKKWALSMDEFKNVGDYKDSRVYYVYARAKMEQGEKKYDKAIKDFKKIKDDAADLELNVSEDITETKYLKGVDLYTQNKYEEAIRVLRPVEKHKESAEYINKAYYAIAENYYNKSKYTEALDIFYALGKFSNSKDRASSIAEEIYISAMNNYRLGKYDKASDGFNILKKYNYKNSADMVNQVTYKVGLDNYLDGSYDNARKYFSKIISYKDSDAMIKESTYRIGKQKYGESVESSLEEFLKIRDYKDVPDFLNKGVFTLYGEWKIVEMNGVKSDEAIFSFEKGGELKSDSEILYAAISTKDNPVHYEWDGKRYSALDGEYKIATERINGQTIKVTFYEGSNSVIFTCVETKDFLTMLDKNTDKSVQEDDKTRALIDLMQNYFNKKTDGETIPDNKADQNQ